MTIEATAIEAVQLAHAAAVKAEEDADMARQRVKDTEQTAGMARQAEHQAQRELLIAIGAYEPMKEQG